MTALGDIIVNALKKFLRTIFGPITKVIEQYAGDLVGLIVGTPHPNTVFGSPTNAAWPNIYDFYWDMMVPLSLFLWALAIGVVIFFESTSHLFSSYHRTKLKKRAFSGLLGVLSWWWLAAVSLRFMDALTGFIVPDLSEVSLFQTLSFGAMGVLGLVVTLLVDFGLFAIIALIYHIRQLVLYLFVLLMPLLIVFWIPGVGPFSLVSRFMKRLAGFYVPFLFMTVPVAILFRLGDLLGKEFGISMGGFGAWLTALVIPFIAILSPVVLVWQAGALFFIADRATRHASARRARRRVGRARETGRTTSQGGRNFVRGVRGEPAIRRDGQIVLDSGGSRAHAAGSRLNAAGSRLSGVGRRDRGGGGPGGGGAGGAAGDGSGSEPTTDGRAEDFENLQDRTGSDAASQRGDGSSADHQPPYLF